MSDRLDQLLFGHSILARCSEVRAKLIWTIHRNDYGDRD
jgi:hypothetical protein